MAGSHSRTVRSALPDGRTLLATGSTDQTMRLWDTEASTCLTRVRLTGVISDIAVVPGTTPCVAIVGAQGIAMVVVSAA